MYINKLDVIDKKYNHKYDSTIKMKLVNINASIYLFILIKNKKEHFKFKVGDHLRISKYKNIFTKGYTPNWLARRSLCN